MTNYYAPGEVHIHKMTEAEKKAERRSQEERRKKYPWRYSGKKRRRNMPVMQMNKNAIMQMGKNGDRKEGKDSSNLLAEVCGYQSRIEFIQRGNKNK